MTRGQFEAMGLALVIVLVSLAMFLLIFFSIHKPSDFVDIYKREKLNQDVVDAMLRTTVFNCSQVTVLDLIEDAAILHNDPCATALHPTSLDLLQNITGTILNETLDRRDLHYEFRIAVDTDPEQVLVEADTCLPRETGRVRTGQQPIPLFPTPNRATVTLALCYEDNG